MLFFRNAMLCSPVEIRGPAVGICGLNLRGVLNWWEGLCDGLIPIKGILQDLRLEI
jgi:hypothetical protein